MILVAQVTVPCDGPAHDTAVALLARVKSAIPSGAWTIDAAQTDGEGYSTFQFVGFQHNADITAIADTLNADIDVGHWSVAEGGQP